MTVIVILAIIFGIVAVGWWMYAEGHFDFLIGSEEHRRVSKGAQKREAKKK